VQVALIRVTPKGESQRVPIERESTIIGRSDDCQIRVRSAGMSRKHCEVLIDGGSVSVRDLGSSNGTFVNQEQVDSTRVTSGDLISFGGLVFVVEVDGEPEQIDAALFFEDGLPETAAPVAPPAGQTPSPKKVSAGNANEDSSMMDFEFNLDDDEDEQPPL